jgi:hypothetical protein
MKKQMREKYYAMKCSAKSNFRIRLSDPSEVLAFSYI